MYCRRCGAALHQGVVICPECGARQRRGISSVRCARCGQHVSLGLTVCPHCGRDVHPAGPRWGLWLLGFAVIALAALWGLDELPIDKVKTEVAAVRTRAARIVQFLGPVAGSGDMTPQAGAAPPATQVIAALPPTAELPPTQAVLPTSTVGPTVAVSATLTVEVAPTTGVSTTLTSAASPTPTATPTTEPTATAPPTGTATPTPEPTAAPTATPTPTRTPSGRVTYKVQSGDSLSSIAAKFGVSWQELAAANDLTARSTLRIGQELVIPSKGQAAPGPTAAPTRAPTKPAAQVKYKVKSGDTLSSIAAQYGITWQELAAANGLTAASRLRVGQELIVPVKGSVAEAAPTAARPTALPPTPTAAPAALLPPPQLVNPGDGAMPNGEKAFIELVWRPVEGMPGDATYRVTIRWTEVGAPQTYLVPVTTATSIIMPTWLFGRADQPARAYYWAVRVVRMTTDGKGGEKEILLSPSSETRVLYWN